uniref:Uncharacterized protein n=1 Tax=Arundo donax TaxID=35708 RepID=A0A0A9FKD8_ARUDO
MNLLQSKVVILVNWLTIRPLSATLSFKILRSKKRLICFFHSTVMQLFMVHITYHTSFSLLICYL